MSVKRSGLGKNLSALLGTATFTKETEARIDASYTLLNIEALLPGKYQPRAEITDESIHELSLSIQQQGLLQPILARKLSIGCYEIIAGERRFRAAKLAGLAEVPVVLRQVDDETALALALVENLQREDLNPIEQARAMARLTQEFSLTHQEIAKLLSKSRAAVSNFLRLLSLSTEVMSMVQQGQLDMGHARALLALENPQQLQAAQWVLAKNLSVRDTENLVARMKAEPSTKPKESLPTYPQAIQEQVQQLIHHLQTKVSLKPGRANKGVIMIHYDSLQSLQTLMSHITR